MYGLHKRGKWWHYDFVYRGRRFQGSTECTNVNKAKDVAGKIRQDLVDGAHGLQPDKDCPLFAAYMQDTFLEYSARHAKTKRTHTFYRDKTNRMLAFEPWKTLRLNQIDAEQIERYAAFRLRSVTATTVNHELATLRKALRLAEEWRLVRKAVRIRLLPQPKGRDFVITPALEAAYLAVAPYPLKQAVILMLDSGLRPEECVRLGKSDIRDSCIHVRVSKTAHGERVLPMTERSLQSVALLSALFPDSPFLFPGKKGKPYTRGALDNLHAKVRAEHGFPDQFVLHSCRHTFATKLGESGADITTIRDVLGHADIRMSARYVHPSTDHLSLALKRKELLDRIVRGEVADPLQKTDPATVKP